MCSVHLRRPPPKGGCAAHISQIFSEYVDSTTDRRHLYRMDSTYSGEGRMTADEKKHAKFRELAEKRTNKALEAVRLIGNLSNRQTYVYEEAEVRKVMKALRDAVSEVEARFSKSTGRGGGEFKL